jgi:hypothetical protein
MKIIMTPRKGKKLLTDDKLLYVADHSINMFVTSTKYGTMAELQLLMRWLQRPMQEPYKNSGFKLNVLSTCGAFLGLLGCF